MNVELGIRNVSFIVISLFVLYCTDIDGLKKKKENKQKTDLLFLGIAQSRSTGNCLRKDKSTNTNYCDRRSSGICNPNDLILTSTEKTFNSNEVYEFLEKASECSRSYYYSFGSNTFSTVSSFGQSGILSDEVTSVEKEDSIKANNNYSTVESCENTGMSSTGVLLSEPELIYIKTSSGRIGLAADEIYNTPDSVLFSYYRNTRVVQFVKYDASICLDKGFTQSEKDLFADLRTGKKVKAFICSNTPGATNACP